MTNESIDIFKTLFGILSNMIYRSDKVGHKKIEEYINISFLIDPHPIPNNNMNIKISQKAHTLANLFFLFITILTIIIAVITIRIQARKEILFEDEEEEDTEFSDIFKEEDEKEQEEQKQDKKQSYLTIYSLIFSV